MKRLLWIAGTIAILIVVQMLLPTILPNAYYQRILMLSGISVILAVSLNLVNGLTGQFSIGHAGFMAVGGYTAAVLTMRVLPPLLTALEGMGLPVPVAQGIVLLIALPVTLCDRFRPYDQVRLTRAPAAIGQSQATPVG